MVLTFVFQLVVKDIKMKTSPVSYGMFTSAGDRLVADLVAFAKAFQLSDTAVLEMMNALSKDESYGEITDTAVREAIGEELGWYA
jgi:hypothetical protein